MLLAMGVPDRPEFMNTTCVSQGFPLDESQIAPTAASSRTCQRIVSSSSLLNPVESLMFSPTCLGPRPVE